MNIEFGKVIIKTVQFKLVTLGFNDTHVFEIFETKEFYFDELGKSVANEAYICWFTLELYHFSPLFLYLTFPPSLH